MPARLRFLGAERGAEAVHLAERRRRGLDVQLAGLGEVGLAEVEVLGREQGAGVLADGAREDRRVDEGEAALVEEIAHRLDHLVTHPGDRDLAPAAQPQMPVLEQEGGAVLLGTDREVGARAEDVEVARRELDPAGAPRIGPHGAGHRDRGFLG